MLWWAAVEVQAAWSKNGKVSVTTLVTSSYGVAVDWRLVLVGCGTGEDGGSSCMVENGKAWVTSLVIHIISVKAVKADGVAAAAVSDTDIL